MPRATYIAGAAACMDDKTEAQPELVPEADQATEAPEFLDIKPSEAEAQKTLEASRRFILSSNAYFRNPSWLEKKTFKRPQLHALCN